MSRQETVTLPDGSMAVASELPMVNRDVKTAMNNVLTPKSPSTNNDPPSQDDLHNVAEILTSMQRCDDAFTRHLNSPQNDFLKPHSLDRRFHFFKALTEHLPLTIDWLLASSSEERAAFCKAMDSIARWKLPAGHTVAAVDTVNNKYQPAVMHWLLHAAEGDMPHLRTIFQSLLRDDRYSAGHEGHDHGKDVGDHRQVSESQTRLPFHRLEHHDGAGEAWTFPGVPSAHGVIATGDRNLFSVPPASGIEACAPDLAKARPPTLNLNDINAESNGTTRDVVTPKSVRFADDVGENGSQSPLHVVGGVTSADPLFASLRVAQTTATAQTPVTAPTTALVIPTQSTTAPTPTHNVGQLSSATETVTEVQNAVQQALPSNHAVHRLASPPQTGAHIERDSGVFLWSDDKSTTATATNQETAKTSTFHGAADWA